MRQIAVTHCGDQSHRLRCCCDKAACAYYVAAICRTNSNQFEFQFEFGQQIAAKKFCRSNNDFHMSHKAICCSNLSRRRVAAICRIVCLGLNCYFCHLLGEYFDTMNNFLDLTV